MVKKNVIYACFSILGLSMLILDSQTATKASHDAISQCITTVVPALFPFFLLSINLTSNLYSISIPLLRPLGKLCGIPKGSEHIFLIGILGGYPVGAKAVNDAWQNKMLTTQDARHLLSFCSNAGPSFIFGITGLCFPSLTEPFIIWIIQITSALLTGILLNNHGESIITETQPEKVSFIKSMDQALRVTASICGWIIFFRIIYSFIQRWFLFLLPNEIGIIISGILELTSGCLQLDMIDQTGLRFILCSVFLTFGGLCVMLQTVNVIGNLGILWYIRGKLIQTLISMLLSMMVTGIIFPEESGSIILKAVIIVPIILCILMLFVKSKFQSRFSEDHIV